MTLCAPGVPGWWESKVDLPSHPHAACGRVPAGQSRARGFTRPSLAGGVEHSAEAWARVRLALRILHPALIRTGAQVRPSAGRAAPVASATVCPGQPGNSLSLRNEAMQRDCPVSLSRRQGTDHHPRAGWQPVCVRGSRGQHAGRAAPRASACPGGQLWSHDD